MVLAPPLFLLDAATFNRENLPPQSVGCSAVPAAVGSQAESPLTLQHCLMSHQWNGAQGRRREQRIGPSTREDTQKELPEQPYLLPYRHSDVGPILSVAWSLGSELVVRVL